MRNEEQYGCCEATEENECCKNAECRRTVSNNTETAYPVKDQKRNSEIAATIRLMWGYQP
ncbi:MAG: hypothetical protein EOP49_19800 [Sphingobacteriales bacterium]|nr:MAG: hypothetical protein EOP49_19800 [Sphingobacteriales bacterium]